MSSDGTWHHSNKYFTRELDDLYGHSYDVDAPYGTNTSNIWASLAEAITKMEELADASDDMHHKTTLPIEAPEIQQERPVITKHRKPNEPRTTIEKLRGVETAFYDKPIKDMYEEDNARQQLFEFMDSLVSRLNRHKNTQPFSFINYELEDYEINLRDTLNTLLYAQLPKKYPGIKVRSFDYTADKDAGLVVILVETNLGEASISLIATNNQNAWKILNYQFTPRANAGMEPEEPMPAEPSKEPVISQNVSPVPATPEKPNLSGTPSMPPMSTTPTKSAKHEEDTYEIIVQPYVFQFYITKDGNAVKAKMKVNGPDVTDDVTIFESDANSLANGIKERSKYYEKLSLKDVIKDLRKDYFHKAIEAYLVSQFPRVAKG